MMSLLMLLIILLSHELHACTPDCMLVPSDMQLDGVKSTASIGQPNGQR